MTEREKGTGNESHGGSDLLAVSLLYIRLHGSLGGQGLRIELLALAGREEEVLGL